MVEKCNYKSNLDCNEPVLVLVTFNDDDPIKDSSYCSSVEANHQLNEVEEGREGINNDGHLGYYYDYGMEDNLDILKTYTSNSYN